MSMGALTLTCLSLLAAQLPQDVWPTNRREFKIPVDIQPHRLREIDRLILYVSTDRGRSWQQDQTMSPDKDGFIFRASQDGEYWFRAAAINRRGDQEPNNLYQGPPDQKVLIDTLKPIVQITAARRQGDDVAVEWTIQETYPDLSSIRLKYRPTQSASGYWSQAQIEPRLRGQTFVRVNDSSPLTFQLEVRDLAGNLSHAQIKVPGSLATAAHNEKPAANQSTAIPGKPDGSLPLPPGTGETPMPRHAENDKSLPMPPGEGDAYKIVDAQPNQGSGKPAVNQVASWDSTEMPPPAPPHRENDAPPEPMGKSETPAEPPTLNKRPVGSGIASNQPPPRTLPPVQYTNKTEMVIAYSLEDIQPGRVGSVELWMTKDDGQRWEKWMEDPTVKPFMQKGPHTRTLNLPGEGIYGLTLVVRNRAGKGKEPRPGDAPEMRIEVDMTAPVAILYAPEASRHDKDAMIISWEARDRNLDQQPITLEWAEQPDGPWKTIAANLPNTGKHAWHLPDSIPVWVYLRLRVRDRAGNEAVAVSNEPQLVDLSEPQGRLIGIVPPSGP